MMLERDHEKIAERHLVLKSGNEIPDSIIKIEIGKPYWSIAKERASCSVFVSGFCKETMLHGDDLMHCLELSISFIGNLLSGVTEPKRIVWPDGSEYENIWVDYKNMTLGGTTAR